MNIYEQLLVLTILFILSFLQFRGFLYGIIHYQMNKSAYKKRKKHKSFKDWLFFTKFRDVIPKGCIRFYIFLIFLHIGAAAICIFCSLLKCSQSLGPMLAKYIMYFDYSWIIILALLFWTRGQKTPYDRWITKKRGMKPKKHK